MSNFLQFSYKSLVFSSFCINFLPFFLLNKQIYFFRLPLLFCQSCTLCMHCKLLAPILFQYRSSSTQFISDKCAMKMFVEPEITKKKLCCFRCTLNCVVMEFCCSSCYHKNFILRQTLAPYFRK